MAAPHDGDGKEAEERMKLTQRHRDEDNMEDNRPASTRERARLGDAGGRRGIDMSNIREIAKLESSKPANLGGIIRGQDGLPGARGGSGRATDLQRGLIRGQSLLPGASGERDQRTSDAIDARGSGGGITADSAASGTSMGSGARCKATVRRQGAASSITWHLEDHAERVAAKRSRLGDQPPPISPAERLAALRARIASRKASCDAAPRGGDDCASAATAAADHGNGEL